jgi:hypothetical protein
MFFIVGMLELYNAKMPASTVKKISPTAASRSLLSASMTVEISPFLQLTPNVFINLKDPSALAQFVFSYDWQQDI